MRLLSQSFLFEGGFGRHFDCLLPPCVIFLGVGRVEKEVLHFGDAGGTGAAVACHSHFIRACHFIRVFSDDTFFFC